MSYFELDEQQRGLSRSQILNSATIALVAVIMLGLGWLMRNSALSATVVFADDLSGIRAQIPQNWLITTDDPAFVLKAEDAGAIPFKTILSVSVLPVGAEATPRNVVDTLTLQRAGQLASYRVLSIEPLALGEDPAIEMNYAYVQTEPNPFLNAVPLVVQGRDVVVIRQNQAIIITYREERGKFDLNEARFDNFLANLDY